jgi:DNA-binding transcriptional regulator YbjK
MTTFQRARSAEQREMRRRAILDAAAGMLAEMPVAEVSLNELSRRAGLAKSNVLRYFDSREAVLLELLNSAWQEWLGQLGEGLAGVDAGASAAERGDRLAPCWPARSRQGQCCATCSAPRRQFWNAMSRRWSPPHSSGRRWRTWPHWDG